MRKIHNNEMVAHLWAHQSQSEARNSTGSLYFNDSTIWSYGSHFPIARHVAGVVLQTTASHSNTTSKHQNEVQSACSHLTSFYVPDVLADSERAHCENFDDYQRRYEETMLAAARALKLTAFHLECAEEIAEAADRYAAHFNIPRSIERKSTDELLEKAKQQAAEQREERKRRDAELREKYKEETDRLMERVAKWKRKGGGFVGLSWNNPARNELGAFLRLDGETVITSHGARVPASDARAAWPIIARCKERGETFESNGRQIRLGHFRLDRIQANGDIHAGCHFIKFEECEYIARELGLLEQQKECA